MVVNLPSGLFKIQFTLYLWINELKSVFPCEHLIACFVFPFQRKLVKQAIARSHCLNQAQNDTAVILVGFPFCWRNCGSILTSKICEHTRFILRLVPFVWAVFTLEKCTPGQVRFSARLRIAYQLVFWKDIFDEENPPKHFLGIQTTIGTNCVCDR